MRKETGGLQAKPLAVFLYDRPDHLRRCLDSLVAAKGSCDWDLFAFGDGPKSDASAELVERIHEARAVVEEYRGHFRSVEFRYREDNAGLARSISEGVSDLCERFGRVVVVEDDLIVAPGFLEFMLQGLELFERSKKVWSISGHSHLERGCLPKSFVFLGKPTSWGWATWKDRWDQYNPDSEKLMAQISSLRNGVDRFNFAGRNFFRMLEDCADGKNDSWAIRFYASAFLKGGLHVTPASTLVLNGGFDGSGEHCPNRDGNDFISPVFEEPFVPLKRALPWKSNLAEKVIAEKWKKERQERRTEK